MEATNRELGPKGLYLTHIWGPEQQILTPQWRDACRPVVGLPLQHLTVTTLGPLDLIVSKLCRADDLDLISHERLSAEAVREAVRQAVVPEVFAEVFPLGRAKLEALLG